jgi:polyferredoxin
MFAPWRSLSLDRFRRVIQYGFAAILFLGGLQFVAWVAHFRYGTPYVPKPSSVEAFLPLSALVGVKGWVGAGYVPRIHPAAFVIFLSVVLTAVFFGRGVCSWACPIGLLQEWVRGFGARLIGKRYRPPPLVDAVLRAIKYLILAFFLKVILLDFSGQAAISFLQSPYNAVSGVKLLEFWIAPSATTILVIGVLVGATMFVEDFWCRYLCPYGALLGIVGKISPASIRVTRDRDSCTHCGACTAACPNRIDVENADVVTDLECTRCSQCIDSCSEGALEYQTASVPVPPRYVGIGIVVILFGAVVVAMATGHWNSALSYETWSQLVQHTDTIGHAPY